MKRLAASFTIAGAQQRLRGRRTHAPRRPRPSRRTGRRWPSSPRCAPWTSGTPTSPQDDIVAAAQVQARGKAQAKEVKRAKKNLAKTRTRDSLQALSKLAEVVDGRYRIVSQPPVVVPAAGPRPRRTACRRTRWRTTVREQFRAYRRTLQDDRRRLLERFRVVDVARKVVGVGSVGTRAWIVLLQGRDAQDPLFLQVKEAIRVGAGGPPAQEPVPAARASGWSRASG